MIVIFPMNLEAPHLHHSCSEESASSATSGTVQKMSTTITPSVRQNTNITKRPKLSLQTSSLPVSCGRSTTALSLSCSTASPTVLNTFNNAYEVSRPLSSTAETPSPSKLSSRSSRYGSPYPFFNSRSDLTGPYQLPLGVRSILRNSPLAKVSSLRRSSLARMSPSGVTERRVYFPAKKQVSYRFPLEEEIRTVRFVARHSDLSSDSESELGTGEESESEGWSDSSQGCSSSEDEGDNNREGKLAEQEESSSSPSQPPTQSPGKKRRKSIPSQRQIRAAAVRDGLDEANYTNRSSSPAVPGAGGPKRRCKWRWTLGDSTGSALRQDSNSTVEESLIPASANPPTSDPPTTGAATSSPADGSSNHE
jgi:hypothetical protein